MRIAFPVFGGMTGRSKSTWQVWLVIQSVEFVGSAFVGSVVALFISSVSSFPLLLLLLVVGFCCRCRGRRRIAHTVLGEKRDDGLTD